MRRIVVVSVGLLLLVGCGGKSKQGRLSGKVTYKSQPLNSATLFLYPAGGNGKESFPISVGQDGTFQVTDVPTGDYKIVVQAFSPPAGRMPNLKNVAGDKQAEAREKLEKMQGGSKPTIPFPDKYKDLAKTPLTCTVKGGSQDLPLELTD
jgi:hypothetical protein